MKLTRWVVSEYEKYVLRRYKNVESLEQAVMGEFPQLVVTIASSPHATRTRYSGRAAATHYTVVQLTKTDLPWDVLNA